MSEIRKICVVVTARPSYSRIKSALKAIDEHPQLKLQLVVSSSALLDRYGMAVNYMEADGFDITARVFNVLEGENLTAQAKTTGLGILELATVFQDLKPDAVVTIADRFETMATAIAASYMNIPLVHVQGGEVTGNIDGKVRHAVTKLADLHFVATEDAKERVIRLGEDPATVLNIGCPSIDLAREVVEKNGLDFDPFKKYGGVGNEWGLGDEYIVVLQHPLTTEYQLARRQIETTLSVINDLDMHVFWFWPNMDAGSDGTSRGIRSFREKHNLPRVHFFKNMEGRDFLNLLRHARCLIGNSSVGIRECAYMGVPVVNIGDRQKGRQRAGNVIDVRPDYREIKEAIIKAVSLKHSPDHLYGDGSSGKRMADALATCTLNYHKEITY